jgi:hypothetical protein
VRAVKTPQNRGVLLPDNETGSGFFHRLLSESVAAFPKTFRQVRLAAEPARFKKTYGDDLVRFESARIGSDERVAIARHLAKSTLASLRFADDERVGPLTERLQETVAAPPTTTVALGEKAKKERGLRLSVPFEGKTYEGKELVGLIHKLSDMHHLTDQARTGLLWVHERAEANGGRLDLTGERFVVLGGAAELSPALLLLGGGADVLWIDRTGPAAFLAEHPHLDGTITSVDGGDDLLEAPLTALAAIRRFVDEGAGPVHLGLFAYAPGASRELRVAAVMDAMAKSLGPKLVKSLSLFISPTSPGEMQPEDRRVAADRLGAHPAWQKALAFSRVLRKPAHFGSDDSTVCRAVMDLQGPGYQAAQYLSKIMSAEALAVSGLDEQAPCPFTVSANVAGITNTRSLAHPLFQLGFVGAPLFGVRIFEPGTTRALSSLLMLHDVLNPDAPASATRHHESENARARAVRASQIHGGVYDMPWQFQSAVQAAAVIGMGRRPGLLFPSRSAKPAREGSKPATG